MNWNGDGDAFDRACLEAQDAAAMARWLRTVPAEEWPAVELRLRVKLAAVSLTPDAERVDGREIGTAFGASEGLARRWEALDAKKAAVSAEGRARREGSARPT
jgi:hypothetical protein